jgi:hypothetical protein
MDKYKMFVVRISGAAHRNLTVIVNALNQTGLNISFTRFVSDLILAQPLPDQNKNGSDLDPNLIMEDSNHGKTDDRI